MQFPSQRYQGLHAVRNRCPGSAVQASPDGSSPQQVPGLRHEPGAARTMRRVANIAAVLIAIAVAFVVATGASDQKHQPTYLVRAIFDDASFAATGEDVRIAGANVGSIQSLGVTSGKRAAVTISIGNPDFTPFHANAHLRDPSAVADRRGVRRLRAGHLEHAAAAEDHSRPRDRQPLPAGHAHQLADRHRHRPEHLPGAGPPVARR